mmetsp:Transcript_9882/g.27421  ORF Transcript_9882/g.27421 Transcript_9882/m.27421 type:complete len:1172 (-) Transcript_9882:144-3659(-)|eukprot:CAMPEP_0168763364 /NCGR_PEP_ID=MMETSP0724-20121128/24323_1 /TAXON_ID=265536 /ORGANISM="Amphiprora sp., Strain CCMP467" /LENGTH=1171 /DNA_ID=CAMNT_0008812561 /DNA_START=563 /DNA_END=4078 /DNA_ORIENTATION=+
MPDSDSDDSGARRKSWALMPPGKKFDELADPVKEVLSSIQIGSQFGFKPAYTEEEMRAHSSSDDSSSSSSESSGERKRRARRKSVRRASMSDVPAAVKAKAVQTTHRRKSSSKPKTEADFASSSEEMLSALPTQQQEKDPLNRSHSDPKMRNSDSNIEVNAEDLQQQESKKDRKKDSKKTKKKTKEKKKSSAPPNKKSSKKDKKKSKVDAAEIAAEPIPTPPKPKKDRSKSTTPNAERKKDKERRSTLKTVLPGQKKKSREELLQEREIKHKEKRKKAKDGKKKRDATPPQAHDNVFAARIPKEDHRTYKAPTFEKTPSTKKLIVRALEQVLPINSLPERNVDKLLNAFELKNFEEGSEILTSLQRESKQRRKPTEKPSKNFSQRDVDDFFYVVDKGSVAVEIDGEEVAQATKGDTVGDTNLYHTKRAGKRKKSVFRAKAKSHLYRIDQKTYRTILQTERSSTDDDKTELINGISLFDNMTKEKRQKLVTALKPLPYQKGDVVVPKTQFGEFFIVVSAGRLISRGGKDEMREGIVENTAKRSSGEVSVERGQYISEDTLLPKGELIEHDAEREVFADTNGLAYQLDRSTFEQVIGAPKDCLLTPGTVLMFERMEALRKTPTKQLTIEQMAGIQSKIVERRYAAGDEIIPTEEDGQEVPAALYFIRQGTVKEKTGRFHKLKLAGGVFGQDLFETAREKDSTTAVPKHGAVAKEDCVIGVLTIQAYLEAFLKPILTPEEMQMSMIKEESSSWSLADSNRSMGSNRSLSLKGSSHKVTPVDGDDDVGGGAAALVAEKGVAPKVSVQKTTKKRKKSRARMPSLDESIHGPQRDYKFEDLKRLKMLGEGQFGQVWLATDTKEEERKAYALKIQSKFELVDMAQAEICIREKEIMSRLNHPMIMKLFATFQDSQFLYMLLDMVNGGELFNRIYPMDEEEEDDDESYNSEDDLGLLESDAKFYCFVLADILKYMHQKKYVYRDLKPENVLMGHNGYPILIDFGFCKKLSSEKTFTLCGTPAYLAPEMVLSLGHSFGVDHWALGIMTHEMLFKDSFFFVEGMDPVTLYKSIAEDKFDPPFGRCSDECCDFLEALLQKDPVYRLGALAGGENDILQHPWFDDLEGNSFTVRKQQHKAPWIPNIKDPFDTQHFEDWEDVVDKTKQKYPELSEKENEIFEDF